MFKELFTESRDDKIVQDVTNYIFVNFEKVTTKHKITKDKLEITTTRPLTDGEIEKLSDKFNYIDGLVHSVNNTYTFRIER